MSQKETNGDTRAEVTNREAITVQSTTLRRDIQSKHSKGSSHGRHSSESHELTERKQQISETLTNGRRRADIYDIRRALFALSHYTPDPPRIPVEDKCSDKSDRNSE